MRHDLTLQPEAPTSASWPDVLAVTAGKHGDPFRILGPHLLEWEGCRVRAVRCFIPGAAEVHLHDDQGETRLDRIHPDGFFEARSSDPTFATGLYRYRCRTHEGHEFWIADPYRFPSLLGDLDRHLLGEGKHYENYERLGAHVRHVDGVRGVNFSVWAPNAKRVAVVGDFNFWDGRRHPMRFHPGIGVWDLFVPELDVGVKYKFEIVGPRGELLPLRTDPYGLQFEIRPRTAAVVCDLAGYEWQDSAWLAKRATRQAPEAPMIAYEVHLGSWARDPGDPERQLSYRELAPKLVAHVKDLGFTHIQLMPVSEHPFDGSWGYQCLGYYAPTSRFGTPHDFMWFVDYCHRHDIGVWLDWVPAHFPRDEHGLRLFDGTACYEHADPRQGEQPEWGTMIFNFGRHETANFLIGSALFWIEKYHLDGLRVDAVASMLYLDYGRKEGEWIPNRYGGNHNLVAAEFLKTFNDVVQERCPGVLTIAEESTSWRGVSHPTKEGGLGFSLKWNMGWMNDTLRYMHRDPIHRKHHQGELTFSLLYAFNERFLMPLSHDEVVHGKGSLLDKMPGDKWQKFANLRLLLTYMAVHPGKKLLFMGGEFGQWQEWRFYQSLDWHLLDQPEHRGVLNLVRDLNRLGVSEPALHRLDHAWEGFSWIDFHDIDACVISFLRKDGAGNDLLIACNFTPSLRKNYRVGVPRAGKYEELLSSDFAEYGGSGVRNSAGVEAMPEPLTVQNQPFWIGVDLPPLGAAIFRVPR